MTAECAAWYGALLAAALFVCARAEVREARSRMRDALFANVALLAMVGLLQKATWNGALLWIRPVAGGRPFGPYVNGTHFAGMMEMVVPWMVAYAAGRWTAKGGAPGIRVALIGSAAAVAFLAGLAAQSKMAAALMAIGLSIVALALFEGAARVRAALGVAAAWVLGSVIVILTPLGERFRELGLASAAGIGDYDRIVAWKAMLPAIRDFWLCGAGYGTFRYLAPSYLPGGDGYGWLQLHNDWLESALSGGLVGSCLLCALAAALVVAIVTRAKGLGSRSARIEHLGIAIGLASLAVHALVDFNHQIPANALTFVTIAAIATSRSPESPAERR
jgi:cell division protein FtsW (lipid II flippase)